jgi:hypothetical protein
VFLAGCFVKTSGVFDTFFFGKKWELEFSSFGNIFQKSRMGCSLISNYLYKSEPEVIRKIR